MFLYKTKNIVELKKCALGVWEKTDECINQNRLTKNAEKMSFGGKFQRRTHKSKKTLQYLGIKIDSNLCFWNQIDKITQKWRKPYDQYTLYVMKYHLEHHYCCTDPWYSRI